MKAEIEVVICPTSREENGLAMSSRNKRLSDEMKDKAKIIYQSFNKIKKDIAANNAAELVITAKESLLQNGFDVRLGIFPLHHVNSHFPGLMHLDLDH